MTRHLDWQASAVCATVDTDVFFPEGPDHARRAEQAKGICARCPVQPQCLTWSLDLRIEHGIVGGLTEAERRTILRARGVRKTRGLRGPGDLALVPGHGTARRIQALSAAGWPYVTIATALEMRSVTTIASALRHGRVTRRTALAVAERYEELVRTSPAMYDALPEWMDIARRRAENRGWAPPAAWAGLDIDDPTAQPLTATSTAISRKDAA